MDRMVVACKQMLKNTVAMLWQQILIYCDLKLIDFLNIKHTEPIVACQNNWGSGTKPRHSSVLVGSGQWLHEAGEVIFTCVLLLTPQLWHVLQNTLHASLATPRDLGGSLSFLCAWGYVVCVCVCVCVLGEVYMCVWCAHDVHVKGMCVYICVCV